MRQTLRASSRVGSWPPAENPAGRLDSVSAWIPFIPIYVGLISLVTYIPSGDYRQPLYMRESKPPHASRKSRAAAALYPSMIMKMCHHMAIVLHDTR
ncbi:hypothetical protein CBM2585_A130066 [Cupriavidus taiwanensis]|nr:hypothetical protein CBM2585_A130066 [Cupriavidus taiwanensis]